MVWTSLNDSLGNNSLGNKPQVLAGPVLRKVTPESVTVWVATRTAATVELYVMGDTGLAADGAARTVAIGKNLHIVAVTARPGSSSGYLTEGVVYEYNLKFRFDGNPNLVTLKDATNQAPLTYASMALPSFALPPKDQNFLRVLQGSCRLPHAEGKDAMPLIDDLIAATANNPYARPHQLLLTGDQIYADDVAEVLIALLGNAAYELLGWDERLPVPASEGGPLNATALSRYPFRRDVALQKAGFTSVDLRCHLMSLGEYLAMYLFVWSDVLWPSSSVPLPTFLETMKLMDPDVDATEDGAGAGAGARKISDRLKSLRKEIESDTKAVEEFRQTLYKVRRALANVPTYMIFDDHDVTDDWNGTLSICRAMYSQPLGLRVMQNALTAYALCQHWGNAPEQFEKTTPAPPGRALLEKLDPGLIAPSQSIPLEQRAARYEQDSEAIRALVGMPENRSEIEQRKAVFHKPGSLQYHFSVEAEGHLIIFTDTRTWRAFPKGGMEPGEFLPPAQLNNQILAAPNPGDRALLVVLSTNAPAVQPIRAASRHPSVAREGAKLTRNDPAPDIFEAWEIPSVAFDRLLNTLTSKMPTVGGELKGRAILLSGDVHHSFATRLIYRADQRFEDQQPQPATAVIAQLVASSFKKEDGDTRGFQDDGYRYSPLIARLAKFIPPHQPEGYVGWNVPPGADLSGYGIESFTHVDGESAVKVQSKIQSKGPTIALWHESKFKYNVSLTTLPHYRYRLDYLTPIGQDIEYLPAAPKIPPLLGSTPLERRNAAENYKVVNSHYRLHNRTPGKEKIIGVNNFGEITFDWGQSYKAVIHTLRWHVAYYGSYWTTYRVSLNPNDNNYPDIKDGTN